MSKWVNAEQDLPEPQQKVLICLELSNGNRFIICGEYIYQFSQEANFDFDDDYCIEWDEKEECAYLVEGWVENLVCWDEYSRVYIPPDSKVTHWMPLVDKPPRTETNE